MAQTLVTEKVGPSRALRFGRAAAVADAALLLLAALLALLAVNAQNPPAAVSAEAPPSEFSSGRALRHLRVISAAPHPLGSDAHAQVRRYIMDELGALGLEAEVQSNTVVNNVVARLKGTGGGEAVLLVAHYDTVAPSPGAGDDGAAVSALLETARALKSSPPLANDLIFLFTDGEEVGRLGVKAFAINHPWMRAVRLALNFDARGSRGPVLMFETGAGNGRLVRQFAAAAPAPVANSLMYDIYKLLPHDTDFTVFKEEGLDGLNFANIDGEAMYHTSQDSLANLDERTLQHEGSYALALARHFGGANLEGAVGGDDAVYFNPFGARLVVYSTRLVLPLAALAVLLSAGLLFYGARRRLLSAAGVAAGAAAHLAGMLGVAVALSVVWQVLAALRLGGVWSERGIPFHVGLFVVGFAALAFALSASVFLLTRERVGSADLMAGGVCLWLLLLVASSIFLPGGSYVFMWPLVAGLVSFGFMLRGGGERPALTPGRLAQAAAALSCVALIAPLVHLLSVALTLAYVGPVMMFVPLLGALLTPQLDGTLASGRWTLPCAAAAAGVACLAAAHF